MNVYKMKGQAEGGPIKTEVKELRIDPRPAPPYRARVKMADKETQVTPERDSVRTSTELYQKMSSYVNTDNKCGTSSLLYFLFTHDFDFVEYSLQPYYKA